MQIQKGLVKYKDRTDIVCAYGLTDDGRQYYFLDENSIPNGNIIASTVLVEAIDPVVVASSVGVIDKNGNVVIPFENKSIKSIAPGLLLVEKANSTTPSVVEAIKLRSDPLAATKLVTTPATIKDNMNAKMGANGRFVFNDQFSEATICDMNGNNLINNEYYSFIGLKNNEALYFSKNTVDSPVVEFSLTSGMFVEPPMPSLDNTPLNVQETEVTQATIDGAMSAQENVNKGFGAGDITAADFEDMAVTQEDSQVMVDNTIPPDTLTAEKIAAEEVPSGEVTENNVVVEDNTSSNKENTINNNGFSPADVAVDMSNTHVDVANVPSLPAENTENKVEAVKLDETTTQDVVPATEENVPAVQDEVKVEEKVEPPVVESEEKEFDSYAPTEEAIDLPITTPVVPEIVDDKTTDEKQSQADNALVSFDFGDNINYSNEQNSSLESTNSVLDNFMASEAKTDEVEIPDFKKDLFDVDLDSDIFAGSTLHADKIVQDSYSDLGSRVSTKDTIIEDVASTMANLISLNKTQKEKIATYEEKIEQIAATHKKVVEKARSQVRDMEVLKAKLKNYETIVSKLESKIQLLDSKVKDQEKIIASQSNELESLRPQIEGKRELARILADAQTLLDQA